MPTNELPTIAPPPVPPTERLAFKDAFSEDTRTEVLTLTVKLRINGQEVDQGESFPKGQAIAGIDFHVLRYLDLAVQPNGDGYDVVGFFPQKA